jgi:two-component system OmpR family sensor kinase
MDGRKGKMSRSLQFRLSLWLSLTIVLVAVAAGFLSASSAFNEAIELQDDQLRQTAAWLQRQHFSTLPIEVAGPPEADPESRLIFLTAQPGSAWQPDDAAPGAAIAEAVIGPIPGTRISCTLWRIRTA